MSGQPQNLRGLKALVGIMAVLIIVGTTVVVGTVIHRLYARFNSPPTPLTSAAPPLPSTTPPLSAIAAPPIALPEGEHIVEIAAAGSELAVLVSTPLGEKVLILNPFSGKIRTALSSH